MKISNFKSFITRLIRHELITGSFYIFIGSIITSFLAFVLNLFLARSLSYVDYGIFASLSSVIMLASIPASSITTILVRFSTDYYSRGQTGKLRNFYKKAAKFIASFSLFALLFFIVTSSIIKSFLRLDNVLYIVVVGFCLSIVYIQTLNNGFLQGMLKFGFMSFTGLTSSLIRLVLGIIFVLFGFRVFSGLWSLFFMSLSSFLISFIPIRSIFGKNTDGDVHIPTREIVRYALPVFVTAFCMTSFISTDVILVKHFFNPHEAGFYGGLSLIGRVIFYFTSPITTVMFPLLIRRYNLGRSFNRLFYLALLLVLIPSLAITGFYFLFPNFVVNLFLGGKDYLSIAPYAGLFGVYLTLFSAINVCVNFFLSLNKTRIAPLVVMAALSQVCLIYMFHANFYQVIGASILVSFVLLIALAAYYAKLFLKLGR